MKNSIQVIKKRRKQIIDLLNHTREISISELSKKMKVSEMTIRRDCDYLSKMGKISKSVVSYPLLHQKKSHYLSPLVTLSKA